MDKKTLASFERLVENLDEEFHTDFSNLSNLEFPKLSNLEFLELRKFFSTREQRAKGKRGKILEKIIEEGLDSLNIPYKSQFKFPNGLTIDLRGQDWCAEIQTTIRERVDGKFKKYDEFTAGNKRYLISFEVPNKKLVWRANEAGWKFVTVSSSVLPEEVLNLASFLKEVGGVV